MHLGLFFLDQGLKATTEFCIEWIFSRLHLDDDHDAGQSLMMNVDLSDTKIGTLMVHVIIQF